MPYAFIDELPIPRAQFEPLYEQLGEAVPTGLILHVSYEREGRMMHLDVWESEADFERFASERLRPAVGRLLGAAGLRFEELPPPVHTGVRVVKVWAP
jgi:hypothetical protein